jgi:hypothetical protein
MKFTITPQNSTSRSFLVTKKTNVPFDRPNRHRSTLHSNSNTAAHHLSSPHHHCLPPPAASRAIAHMGQAWVGTISAHAMSRHHPSTSPASSNASTPNPLVESRCVFPNFAHCEFSELAMSLTTARRMTPPTHTSHHVTLPSPHGRLVGD